MYLIILLNSLLNSFISILVNFSSPLIFKFLFLDSALRTPRFPNSRNLRANLQKPLYVIRKR